VLSDRIKILRNATWPDINIAPQVLISCEHPDNGCHGGNPISAWKYIKDNNITDETCAIYQAGGHDDGVECSNILECRNCPHDHGDCFIPNEYRTYTIDTFGGVHGEYAIMNELYKNGPVACGIAATPELEGQYTGGIFHDRTKAMQTNHDVSIVGYGEESGVKFWTIRNSWGTHWGEDGFFRIVRGINNLAIESNCSWAIPHDDWTVPTMKKVTALEKADLRNNVTNGVYPFGPPHLNPPKPFLKESERSGCRVAQSVPQIPSPPLTPAN